MNGTLESSLHPADSGTFLVGRIVGGVVKAFESGVVDSDFDVIPSRVRSSGGFEMVRKKRDENE